LPSAAARSAYYCVFHTAEALIFEMTGKVAKTHSGVRAEFARLMPGEADRWMRTFLADAYRFKENSRLRFRRAQSHHARHSASNGRAGTPALERRHRPAPLIT